MSTTSKGVAKNTEKGYSCYCQEKNAMLRKKVAPQLCNDYFPRGSKTRSVLSYQWINTACKFATGTPLHCLSKKLYISHLLVLSYELNDDIDWNIFKLTYCKSGCV
jgi:hypothetical protein